MVNTKYFILTFNSPSLPTRIKAAYMNCPVLPYIPDPLHCFKSQRYGRNTTACHGSIIFASSAEVGHHGNSCANSECCINYKGDHSAYSRSCPNCIREKKSLQLTHLNLSYAEARKIVES